MKYKTSDGLDIFYREGTSDEYVIHETFNDRIFERGFPEYKLKKKHIVIDVGAHIGTYSIRLAQQLSEGTVYSLEPCLDTFNLLEKNVLANNIKNVKAYKIALSNSEDTAMLYYDLENGNWGHSIVKEFSQAGEIVDTETLSGFLVKNNIQSCDYIKFNCEGAEFDILLSTPATILRKIKKMLVLYHLDLADNHSIEQLINHLKNAGFYTEIRQKRYDERRGWLIAIQASTLEKIKLTSKRMVKQAYRKLKGFIRWITKA